ncbi:Inositol-tetrakisphosphate 1-kinase [Tyrophagus putrescentiae]|nr:Inositol-tetrakisphosphate 1-kinase [Tyrophagus putrescentiae]
MATMSRIRVGYWWSEKKSQKMNLAELARQFTEKGCEFVRLDLDADLEAQGPFDAIIHKLSDVMCKADRDSLAAQQVKSFENYAKAHPEVVIIDSLDNVRKVLDRSRQYQIIDDSELASEDGVFTPTFVEMTSTDVQENLNKMKEYSVKFPFVCKPILAHGTKYAHKMSIIFDENGLKDINPPCVAQTFINHNARLFKLFIIRDRYFVIERPSIKNFKPSDKYETVHFDSHDISKPYSSSELTALDEEDAKTADIAITPEKERLDRIVKVIRGELGLNLMGIDVIIENETGRYAIIDMNSFPGYDGVDNFLELYCGIVMEDIEAARQSQLPPPSTQSTQSDHNGAPNEPISGDSKQANISNGKVGATSSEIDSGIDTSDSCDEKKPKSAKSESAQKKKQHCRVAQ